MFRDLVTGADMEHAPEWMRDLWTECTYLVEEMDDWFTSNGEPDILSFVGEFRKTSYAYIKSGLIAHEIRLRRHYLSASINFTTFCEKWLGRSIWQVNRLIDAASVAIKLMSMGFTRLPANEAQCRPLVKLTDFDLETVWQKVCRFIPEKDVTAKAIAQFIHRTSQIDPEFAGKAPAKRIQLTQEQYQKLEQRAAAHGMTPNQYLDVLLEKELADEPEPEPELPPKPKRKTKKRKQGFSPVEIIAAVVGGDRPTQGIPAPT